MLIGVLKEPDNDPRVAMLPATVKLAKNLNAEVIIENDAGLGAYISDTEYQEAGAKIDSRANILENADILIQYNPFKTDDIQKVKAEAILIAVFQAQQNTELIQKIKDKGLRAFSLERIPRISRAQTMDVLSSMAIIAGYKAVLIAASKAPKFFPMLTTAAGTITPAKVLILGAGVAGLMAIATARRLGAVVEVFDVRSAVKEEVKSLGAGFIEVEGAVESEDAGGYAVEQTDAFKKLQQEKINEHAIKSDIIITTAQIPNKKAPLLLNKTTVERMKKGTVIVDLAASTGGNCELTESEKSIVFQGIQICGYSNLPQTMPVDASGMYGKNVINFLKLFIKDGKTALDFNDQIIKDTCIAGLPESKTTA